MKKLILAVVSLFMISAASSAQTTAPAVKKADKPTVAVTAVKKETPKTAKVVKMAPATTTTPAPATTTTTTTTTTTATPTKKDGTPDKRFKANKVVVKPTKKDGTPDMRYKENKMKPKN